MDIAHFVNSKSEFAGCIDVCVVTHPNRLNWEHKIQYCAEKPMKRKLHIDDTINVFQYFFYVIFRESEAVNEFRKRFIEIITDPSKFIPERGEIKIEHAFRSRKEIQGAIRLQFGGYHVRNMEDIITENEEAVAMDDDDPNKDDDEEEEDDDEDGDDDNVNENLEIILQSIEEEAPKKEEKKIGAQCPSEMDIVSFLGIDNVTRHRQFTDYWRSMTHESVYDGVEWDMDEK